MHIDDFHLFHKTTGRHASEPFLSVVLRTVLCLTLVSTAGVATAQQTTQPTGVRDQSTENVDSVAPGQSENTARIEQNDPESENAPTDDPSDFVMEEVVVTARKREQSVFDVPLSLSTIQGGKSATLRAAGMDLRFLSNRAPSLQMESSFGRTFPRFYIRGLGNTDFDLNASQPVSVVYDGIVMENVLLKGYPAFDLDRIEVLRGPQGTLFGRNTPAGIVKLESARPTGKPEGFGRLGYGRFNSTLFEGAVSGPLGSSGLSARLSVLAQRRSDWIQNDHDGPTETLGGFRELAGRLQLRWKPSPEFETLVKLHARDFAGHARAFRANVIRPGQGGLVDDFDRSRVAIDGRNSQELNAYGATVTLQYQMEGYRLVSLTGMERLDSFARGDIDGGFGAVFSPPSGPGEIPFPSETASGIPFLRQFSQEVRLVSPENRFLDYQIGLYYLKDAVDIEDYNYNTLGGGTPDGYARQRQEVSAAAAFAATTLHLSDAFEFSGGLRLSRDAKDYTAWRDEAPAVTQAEPLGPVHLKPTDTAWSGDLSMRYVASPQVQTYWRVARGFRAPSIQGRLLFGDEVSMADTETIHSFEGGTKLRLRDGRLHLDLAAFHYRLRNQQLTAVGGETNFNRLVNAERTLGWGFEADVAIAPLGRLEITGGLSYNHTRIDDDRIAVQPCGSPCTVLDPPRQETGTVLIGGNGLPQAPRWIGDAALRYPFALPSGSYLVASADLAFRSAIRFFLYESEEYRDDRLLECGARLSYLMQKTGMEISLVGRNIFNDVSLTGGIDFNNLTGFVNEPPYWGMELARYF